MNSPLAPTESAPSHLVHTGSAATHVAHTHERRDRAQQ
jgi:hypothetical protein